MSNGGVNARPEDVKRLASALEHYQRKVIDAGKEFQGALNSASWNDAQKEKFASKYAESQKRLTAFVANDSKPMIQYLNEYARRLDEVRGMRM